jgi:hypothetical protein
MIEYKKPNSKFLDEYVVYIYEETNDEFMKWNGRGTTNTQGGLFSLRLPYIKQVHIVEPSFKQLLITRKGHCVSIIQSLLFKNIMHRSKY